MMVLDRHASQHDRSLPKSVRDAIGEVVSRLPKTGQWLPILSTVLGCLFGFAMSREGRIGIGRTTTRASSCARTSPGSSGRGAPPGGVMTNQELEAAVQAEMRRRAAWVGQILGEAEGREDLVVVPTFLGEVAWVEAFGQDLNEALGKAVPAVRQAIEAARAQDDAARKRIASPHPRMARAGARRR
jgi:hypothetical protein